MSVRDQAIIQPLTWNLFFVCAFILLFSVTFSLYNIILHLKEYICTMHLTFSNAVICSRSVIMLHTHAHTYSDP